MNWLTDNGYEPPSAQPDPFPMREQADPRARKRKTLRGAVIAGVACAVALAGMAAIAAAQPSDTGTGSGVATTSVPDSQPSTAPAPQSEPLPEPIQSAPAAAIAEQSAALAALETLPIKGRAPKTGYDRDDWSVWSDFDGNRCDERQDTLARDLTDVQRVGCDVVGGRLVDPYTGDVIVVPTADPQIDIDHVVSLSDAWQKGAGGWSLQRMQQFASDPLNLLAVSASANRSKSDGDAATWLPRNTSYRCDMVARQIAVKREYGLWVTQAEHDAMARVLAACPDQQLPTRGQGAGPVTATSATQGPAAPQPAAAGLDPQFGSCKAAKAAGLDGNYVRGRDPEYDWYRDGDGDGVVCE